MFRKRSKIIVLSLILASVAVSGCGQPTGSAAVAETTSAVSSSAERTEAAETTEAPETTEAAKEEVTDSRVGISSDKAESEEYLAVLADVFHEYANSSYPFADDLEAMDIPAAKLDLDNMEAALAKVEAISAPDKFADLQARLVGTLTSEREYISNCRKFIGYCEKADSLTEQDIQEVEKLNEDLANAPAEFASVYIEVVRTVKADIDN